MLKVDGDLVAKAAESLAIAGRSACDMAGFRIITPAADEKLRQLIFDALATWLGDDVTDVWN